MNNASRPAFILLLLSHVALNPLRSTTDGIGTLYAGMALWVPNTIAEISYATMQPTLM